MPGLFGSGGLFKQKPLDAGAMDSSQADSLALLQAMQQSSQAGLQRTASPMGSIAQNLMPLFGALIYSQAAQSQAAAQREDAQSKRELLRSQVIKNLAQAAAAGHGGKGGFESAALDAMDKGDRARLEQIIQTQQAMRAEKSPNILALEQRAQSGDQGAQALLEADKARQIEIQSAGAAGRIAADRAAKKPMTPEVTGKYATDIQGLDSVNKLLDQFEANPPTKGSAALASATRGYMADPIWREYARFYNNVGHGLYGGQFTKNEAERLHQVLPPPGAYALDPEGFYKALAGAREDASSILKKQFDYDSSSFETPPTMLADVVRATSPRGKAAGKSGNAKDGTFSLAIPDGMEPEIDKLVDQMLQSGKSEQQIGVAIDSLIKSRKPK